MSDKYNRPFCYNTFILKKILDLKNTNSTNVNAQKGVEYQLTNIAYKLRKYSGLAL